MCSLNDLQMFFQSLPLYTLCLFSMLLNDDIVNMEKPDGIYLLTFAVDEFSDYFYIDQSFLLQKYNFHK